MVGMLLLCIYLDMARVSGNNIFTHETQLIDLYTHMQPKRKKENKQL